MSKFVNNISEGYAEESQAHPFSMILCKKESNGDIVSLHAWIKCRDFVAEALFSELSGKPKSIYSFGWSSNYKDRPLLNGDRLYMAVRADEKSIKSLTENLPALRAFERTTKLAKRGQETKIMKVTTGDANTLILSSPTGWRISPTVLNFYTLVVKTTMFGFVRPKFADIVQDVCDTEIGTFNREKQYWKEITAHGWDFVERMVRDRDTIFDLDWTKYGEVLTFSLHHGHGPVSFFNALGWYLEDGKDGLSGACEVIRPSVERLAVRSAGRWV